jgi:hypothetical protein
MNEVIDAVKKHITNSFSALDPQSFSQEPAYVAALMGRLVGTAWENDEGAFVKIKTTVVNDHGSGAAEKNMEQILLSRFCLMARKQTLQKPC